MSSTVCIALSHYRQEIMLSVDQMLLDLRFKPGRGNNNQFHGKEEKAEKRINHLDSLHYLTYSFAQS